MKFYRCKKCPNIVIKLSVGRCTPACCGELMDELEVNTVDAAFEKHIPVIVEENGEKYVSVGSVEHPSLPAQQYDSSFHQAYRKLRPR